MIAVGVVYALIAIMLFIVFFWLAKPQSWRKERASSLQLEAVNPIPVSMAMKTSEKHTVQCDVLPRDGELRSQVCHAHEQAAHSGVPQCQEHTANDSIAIDVGEIVDETSERPVSYIRFTGYTDSEVTCSDRSSESSYWSALTSPPGEFVTPREKDSATAPKKPADFDFDRDVVEIVDLYGRLETNVLFFKPPRHRLLATKRVPKPPVIRLVRGQGAWK